MLRSNQLKMGFLERDFERDNLAETRLKILPVLTREHYTSLLHWV
jgi:hypothetical protein